MQTLRFHLNKLDMEKTMIMLGMVFMEMTGAIFLVCGLFGIRIL